MFTNEASTLRTAITKSLSYVTLYTYDVAGSLTTVTDTLNFVTTYAYDALSRPVTVTYPVSGTTIYRYDANGNQTGATDPNSKSITNTYDALNRLTKAELADRTVDYTYDKVGARTAVTETKSVWNWWDSAWSYRKPITVTNGNADIYGRKLMVHGSWGSVVQVNDVGTGDQNRPAIAMDGLGNAYTVWEDRRSGNYDIYYASLKTGESAWSASQKVSDDTGSANQERPRIASDREGNLQVVWHDWRNGYTDIYHSKKAVGSTFWTPNDKVNDDTGSGTQWYPNIALDGYGDAVMVWEDTRDGNGNLYSAKDSSATNAYRYDSLYRLTEANSPSASAQYRYDPVGNRTAMTDTTKVLTYTYDANDRIATAGGKGVTFDANGNLLTKDGVTYRYDAANRLTTILSGTLVATFEYNPDGLRTSATINGVKTNYLWDVNASLPVIVSDTNSVYVYGLSLIARQTGSDVEYYHSDALGSVRSLTNGSGQNVGAYSYKSFGEPKLANTTSANAFQYTGQLYDQEAGLHYLRARYYEPSTGRFISRDPFSGYPDRPQSLNLYVYSLNDPMLYTDPSGYDGLEDFWKRVRELALWSYSLSSDAQRSEALSDWDDANRRGDEEAAWRAFNRYMTIWLGDMHYGGYDSATCYVGATPRVSALARTPKVAASVPGPSPSMAKRIKGLLLGPGYNASPEGWFSKHPTLGQFGRSPITNKKAITDVIGEFEGKGGKVSITRAQATALEQALGITPNSLAGGFRISKVESVIDRGPATPYKGNTQFLGPGKGLPGGGPELTIEGISSVGGPGITQIIVEVIP